MTITTLTVFALATAGVLLLCAGLLHLLPRCGAPGCAVSAMLQRAPGLDGVITVLTILPPVVGAVALGWGGLAAGVVGQLVAMIAWMRLHELANRDAVRGPRIKKVLNRNVGAVRNTLGVWCTLPAVPLFWIVRVAEWMLYPPLVWIVRFPRYDQGEWVNVSRQKFSGLVGADLIWCLYCDWMTGVWSLGTEMLRNVESFWCPIRFDSAKKCDNCRIDFPDLDGGWVDARGTMADVVAVLDAKYPPDAATPNAWYGHPARLTVEGRDADPG